MVSLHPPGLLRRFDPTRDTEAVISLVEEAFGLKNDPEGQSMLQQMRTGATATRVSPLLQLAAGGTEGFVWEVDGQTVGNISLLPFHWGIKPIILVANVAVDQRYQDKGIGTELTRYALRVARQQPFSEIWLQVRSDNARAIRMYLSLGFRYFSSLTQWRLPAEYRKTEFAPHRSEGVLFRRRWEDWTSHKAWLALAYPEDTRWYTSFNFNLLKPFAWLNPFNLVDFMNISTFCLRSHHKLVAAITHQQTARQANRLWLAVDEPKPDDERVFALLEAFLAERVDDTELTLEFPVGWAAEAISKTGFLARRDLDWMRYQTG